MQLKVLNEHSQQRECIWKKEKKYFRYKHPVKWVVPIVKVKLIKKFSSSTPKFPLAFSESSTVSKTRKLKERDVRLHLWSFRLRFSPSVKYLQITFTFTLHLETELFSVGPSQRNHQKQDCGAPIVQGVHCTWAASSRRRLKTGKYLEIC